MKRLTVVFLFIMMIWSDSDSQMWTKADSLSEKYLLQGKYDSALYYAEESAAILRGTLGEKNLRYASALTRLAVAQYYLGNYKKAEYYILKDAELRESLKAANDQEYLNTLRTASVICRKSGNYDEALTQIHKADAASRKILKEDTPQYADLLQSFAAVYHDLGSSVSDMVSFNTEEKYLKRAEAIYLKWGDKTTEKLILNKSDQAALNNNIGNSPQAEFLLQEAIDLCLKVYGPESPGYGSALNNMGVLYYNIGNYKLAEKFLVEAVEVCTKSADAREITKAICLNNLGALYHEMGNYIPAGKLISDAQNLLIEERQQENPLFSVLLNNQASVIISQEYYATAENKSRERLAKAGRELVKADSIFRLNCRKPHPYYQAMTGNLGIWYNLAGDKVKSRKLLNDMAYDSGMGLRVVAMMSKMSVSSPIPSGPELTQGPDAAIIPISVNLLDQISASNMEGQYTGESDAFTNAILRMALGKANNIKKAVGPYHPAYATMLKMLIVTYASADDVTREEELKLEYLNVVNHKTLQDFSFLSDSEKELYFQTRLPDMHDFTSYSLKRKIKNPGITSHTYNNILLNKGLMLKSSTAMRLAILNSGDPALLRQYDEWIALQKEISVLYATPVEFRTRDVAVLEESANALERSLVASSQDFSTYRNGLQLTWEDVRKSLKPDEAAIEFTDFKKKEKDGGDEVIYCALIVRSNSAYPEMVKLFEENQLKAIIDRSGLNNINDINEIYGRATSQNDLLYNLIWKPIETYLADIKNVYISPSGLLNKISFPAISNGKGVFLCDNYKIQIKGSTATTTGQNIFTSGNTPSAMVLGGIEYSQGSAADEVWGYLAGTKEEGDVINDILLKAQMQVSYLTESKATESFFKQNARNYNILHLATHGFFFDDPNEIRFSEESSEVEYGEVTFRGAARGFGVNSFVNNENPLMRSGLVLAGANDVWVKTEKGDSDDGVLTAQEVTQIDMRKNDLVVLSACETGLGDIRGTEGVYGLQRSLKMAGVKYIIMSLWEIPDKETVEFMTLFYSNLLKTKDIKEAFYGTQKAMRLKYDPYYWGAFVLLE